MHTRFKLWKPGHSRVDIVLKSYNGRLWQNLLQETIFQYFAGKMKWISERWSCHIIVYIMGHPKRERRGSLNELQVATICPAFRVTYPLSFMENIIIAKMVLFVCWKLTEFPIWLHIFKFLLNNTKFQSSYISEMSNENWKANLIWLYNKSMNIKVLINFTNVNNITITFKERP